MIAKAIYSTPRPWPWKCSNAGNMKKKKFGILQNDVVKEGKNGVKYRKAILVTYEMIDIVDAMTIFVAQPTQDIRVQNISPAKLTQI